MPLTDQQVRQRLLQIPSDAQLVNAPDLDWDVEFENYGMVDPKKDPNLRIFPDKSNEESRLVRDLRHQYELLDRTNQRRADKILEAYEKNESDEKISELINGEAGRDVSPQRVSHILFYLGQKIDEKTTNEVLNKILSLVRKDKKLAMLVDHFPQWHGHEKVRVDQRKAMVSFLKAKVLKKGSSISGLADLAADVAKTEGVKLEKENAIFMLKGEGKRLLVEVAFQTFTLTKGSDFYNKNDILLSEYTHLINGSDVTYTAQRVQQGFSMPCLCELRISEGDVCQIEVVNENKYELSDNLVRKYTVKDKVVDEFFEIHYLSKDIKHALFIDLPRLGGITVGGEKLDLKIIPGVSREEYLRPTEEKLSEFLCGNKVFLELVKHKLQQASFGYSANYFMLALAGGDRSDEEPVATFGGFTLTFELYKKEESFYLKCVGYPDKYTKLAGEAVQYIAEKERAWLALAATMKLCQKPDGKGFFELEELSLELNGSQVRDWLGSAIRNDRIVLNDAARRCIKKISIDVYQHPIVDLSSESKTSVATPDLPSPPQGPGHSP